jgi:hypothetical protein
MPPSPCNEAADDEAYDVNGADMSFSQAHLSLFTRSGAFPCGRSNIPIKYVREFSFLKKKKQKGFDRFSGRCSAGGR